jgi:hypothetical protein
MRLTVQAAAPTPNEFLQHLLQHLAPHLVNAPASDLATVLQQLGALRYVPQEDWLTGVLAGAEGQLAAAGDQVRSGVLHWVVPMIEERHPKAQYVVSVEAGEVVLIWGGRGVHCSTSRLLTC